MQVKSRVKSRKEVRKWMRSQEPAIDPLETSIQGKKRELSDLVYEHEESEEE